MLPHDPFSRGYLPPQPFPVPQPPSVPLPDAHDWVFQLTVKVEVIRNEDGKFKGRGPYAVHLNNIVLNPDAIFCIKCTKPLPLAWETPCEEATI